MENELPECPICLDIYGINQDHIRAPKVLKCGDSFCKDCLEGIIKKSKEEFFKCPTCNQQIKKYKNIEEYTTNKELIRLINSSFNLPEKENQEEEIDNKPISFNIISLGSSGVGKTSIFIRLLKEKFLSEYKATISIDFLPSYYVKYKRKKYKLNFYDTGGQEKFNSLTVNYLRSADGVLFVFDLSDKETFEELEMWYNFFKNEKEKIIGVLIGNKSDNNRQVSYEEATKFAIEHELEYFETSAKLDKSIKKVIVSLLNKIIKYKEDFDNLDSSSLSSDINQFQIKKEKLNEESFCVKYCKKLNPLNWFNKK